MKKIRHEVILCQLWIFMPTIFLWLHMCMDSNLRFWDIYSAEVPCQVASVTNALCCRYSPDGTTLAVGYVT